MHIQLLSPGTNQLQYNIWYHMWFFQLVLYDLSLTVSCLKAIKLNRNYVLKRSSALPEYLWLGSSGYILAGREGGCGRHGEQTDAFVCFDYHQYLLADQPVHISLCIWPGKKTIKAIDMTIFCKTWWSIGHSILPIGQGWHDLVSYSRPPAAKISHKRISDSSSRNAARLLTQGVPFSCLICK